MCLSLWEGKVSDGGSKGEEADNKEASSSSASSTMHLESPRARSFVTPAQFPEGEKQGLGCRLYRSEVACPLNAQMAEYVCDAANKGNLILFV